MNRIINPEPGISDGGVRALAAAVVQRAAYEAIYGDYASRADAAAWLQDDGELWCAACGYDLTPEAVAGFLKTRKDKAPQWNMLDRQRAAELATA